MALALGPAGPWPVLMPERMRPTRARGFLLMAAASLVPDATPVPIVEDGLPESNRAAAASAGLATESPVGSGRQRRAGPPPAHADRYGSAGTDLAYLAAKDCRVGNPVLRMEDSDLRCKGNRVDVTPA